MAFPPPPAYPAADQEEATPAESQAEAPTEPPQDDTNGEVLKNHIYLPKDFPFPKPLKAGDEEKALITYTYVEDNDAGEHCFKIDTVDGVPITAEAEDKESEDQEAEMPDNGTEGDQSQEPQEAATPPSTPNDVTKMIMSGAGQ